MSVFCEGCGADLGEPGHDIHQNDDGEYLCDGCWDDEQADMDREEFYPESEDDYMIDGVGFADPGGRSALRAATKDNPRNLPCPTCGRENMLTPLDRAHAYCCDICADAAEGRGGYGEGEY